MQIAKLLLVWCLCEHTCLFLSSNKLMFHRNVLVSRSDERSESEGVVFLSKVERLREIEMCAHWPDGICTRVYTYTDTRNCRSVLCFTFKNVYSLCTVLNEVA